MGPMHRIYSWVHQCLACAPVEEVVLSISAQLNIRRQSRYIYCGSLISKEEYYGLFIGFRPSGRVQPVQLWWLVNLPVNSLSQISTFDLLRLTIKAAIAFDRCVLIRGSILLIVCVLADFEIGCKIHWNHFTDEPIMPSYATVSFAQLHGNDLKWWPICSR